MASQRARRFCDSSGANSGVTSSLLRGQLLFRIAKNDYRRAGFWATATPGLPARVVFERWRPNRRLSDHFRFFEFRCFRALSNICERYVNRGLREAFGQAKCIRTLKSLSASWRVADPG